MKLSLDSVQIEKRENLVFPFFVTEPGFEPRLAESESDVLPLHYSAIMRTFLVTPQGLEPWTY